MPQIVQKLGKTNFGHQKMTFSEKIFFAYFSDQKTRKNFKKSEKFEKLPKMPHIIQKLGKTNLGTKNDIFRENFFRPFFRPKNWKISKKNEKF